MKYLHSIEVKPLPATDTPGTRIKLCSYKLKESVIIPLDYSGINIYDQAAAYLKDKKGIEILHRSEVKTGYILLTDNYISIK